MRVFLFLLLCLMLADCGTNTPPVSQQAVLKSAGDKMRTSDTLHHYDTLFFGTRKLVFTPLEAKGFDSITDMGFVPDILDNDCELIQQDAKFISQKDSTISIRCTNGQKVVLTEHLNCDGDEYIDYTYGGQLDKTPFVVFKVGYDERLDYLIINLNTGKQVKTWGTPSLSSDDRFLVSSSYDLDVGFLHNGIQVFSMGKDSLKLLWQQEFTRWGPEELKWLDKQTVVIKQATPDQKTGKEIVAFSKMKLNE